MAMALSDVKIRSLKARDKTYKVSDDRGLFLEVNPTGSRLWRYRYLLHGKDKRIALGSYPQVGLAEARQKRDEVQRQIAGGADPVLERRRAKLTAAFSASNTFGDIAKEYIEKMVADGRAEATTVKANWLLEQLKPITRMPVADLKPIEVLAALKKLEARGKHETARRCRSFASRVFRYAVATGRGEHDPTSVLRGALIVPRAKHHAALVEPDAVGELLRAIDAYEGNIITRLACQIAPHVMLRPGELRRALWCEIDLAGAVWTVPAERMKMRRPHAVPISRQVLAYLEMLYAFTGPEGFVFPAFHTSRRPMSENTLNQAFRRMGYATGEVTAHGLRTTASSLLNESGKWSLDAIERSLAHADPNAIRGIYNRGRYWDERVAMHQWWSDHIDELRARLQPSTRHSMC
jgi:integrase